MVKVAVISNVSIVVSGGIFQLTRVDMTKHYILGYAIAIGAIWAGPGTVSYFVCMTIVNIICLQNYIRHVKFERNIAKSAEHG
jgi:hypothetical protein